MDWLYEMANEFGLIDIDYMDYAETNTGIIARMFSN